MGKKAKKIEYEESNSIKDLTEEQFSEKFKNDFFADVEAKKQRHAIMNYSYLQYKGILALNTTYGREYTNTLGMQINVPRTFQAVETFRTNMIGRTMNITATPMNKSSVDAAKKAKIILKGEWERSKSDNPKMDAEWNAFVFGTGYLLSQYEDDRIDTEVAVGMDTDGTLLFEEDELIRYQGMRVKNLNPYHVFQDKDATTNDPNSDGTWGHCYLYSIWDYQRWVEICELNDFNMEGMEKGGYLEEFDYVRKQIDSLYTSFANSTGRQRTESGQIITAMASEQKADFKNKIMVVERFEDNAYAICSGPNWTINHRDTNPDPDKRIPIHPIRDIQIPGEFEGMGEPEIIRWQQYEENKIHNLSYMQVLKETVQRYGVVESYLVDPVDARSSNPLRPIRVKAIPGLTVNDAIQSLNQGKGTQYPKDFLADVKDTNQATTGTNDYMTGGNQSQADTLGEAELMKGTGNDKVLSKISQMEKRDLSPVFQHWLQCIPHYYTDELDLKLYDGGSVEKFAKFLPFVKKFNDHPETVARLATQEGVQGKTLEEVYINAGYKDVVFADDIMQQVDITVKGSIAVADMNAMLTQFQKAVGIMQAANAFNMTIGRPPEWDISALTEEILTMFDRIIQDPENYKISPEEGQAFMAQAQATAMAEEGGETGPPTAPTTSPTQTA